MPLKMAGTRPTSSALSYWMIQPIISQQEAYDWALPTMTRTITNSGGEPLNPGLVDVKVSKNKITCTVANE